MEKDTGEINQPQNSEYSFKWYELSPENPFNKKILDCRSLTQTILSGTKNRNIADTFSKLRSSIGEEYINKVISNGKLVNVNLIYPHNGAELSGAVFKADCMEHKWDIYVWNNCFYFTHSWTGELIYKAFATITKDQLIINKIQCIENEFDTELMIVADHVHYLIITHAMGKVFPHRVPNLIIGDKNIALYSFTKFGKLCWYATYDTILDASIKTEEN